MNSVLMVTGQLVSQCISSTDTYSILMLLSALSGNIYLLLSYSQKGAKQTSET